MKIIKLILVTFMLLVGFVSHSQQQVMFTQYMFNGLAINPAYAGSHETISLTALAREQWTGIDGAPSTQALSVHSPIINQRIGVGLLVLNDKIGVTNQTGAYGSYSYKLPLSKGNLALGLQIGFSSYNAEFSKVGASNSEFVFGDVREVHPNAGFGAYYSTDRFYAGFSVPQLIENTFDKDNPESNSKIVRHYFVTSGYVFDLNSDLKLKPSFLIKTVAGAPTEFDLNTNLLIHDVLWVGVSWRSFASINALIQVQATDKLQIGYAYDIASTKFREVSGGSHEIMANYRFKFSDKQVVTPRYF